MNSKMYIEGADYQQLPLVAVEANVRKKLRKKSGDKLLDTFAYQSKEPIWIQIDCPEFYAICPFSRFPDFGTVVVDYMPSDRCLELKSWKMLINAFGYDAEQDIAPEKIFHESVTAMLHEILVRELEPKKLRLRVIMNRRGNVGTVCSTYFKCKPTDFSQDIFDEKILKA